MAVPVTVMKACQRHYASIAPMGDDRRHLVSQPTRWPLVWDF